MSLTLSDNIKTPINLISQNLQQYKCREKCQLKVKYGISDCDATNMGSYILLTYNGHTEVRYNNENYKIEEVRIYSPSLNYYNDGQASAELYIHHTSSAGSNLLLCIPLEPRGASTSASLLEAIIPFVPTDIAAKQQINVSNYSLMRVLPQSNTTSGGAGFYTFNGTLPYAPFSPNFQIVMFDINNAVSIREEDVATLSQLLEENPKGYPQSPSIPDKQLVAYNSGGIRRYDGGGGNGNDDTDIYFDCNPSSSSSSCNGGGGNGGGNQKDNTVNQSLYIMGIVILVMIIGVILLYIILFLYNYMSGGGVGMGGLGVKKIFTSSDV